MEVCPKTIGTITPQANIFDLDGKQVSLDSICNSKPTVLIFYRGGWCPYCKRHLGELQMIENEIKELGYQIVALSADHYSTAPKVVDKKDLTYSIYSDYKQDAAKAYGVSFKLDEKTYKKQKNVYQMDIEKWNQTESHELPVPSVFIIKDLRIKYSYVNPEYQSRLSSKVLLAVLRDIEEKKVPTSSAIPNANPADVNSPEAIVLAGLSAITHDKGSQADWNRFKSLFLTDAKISVLQHKKDSAFMMSFGVAEFIEASSKHGNENGFKEFSTGNTIEEYNGIATVFQSYVALHGDKQVKGVNTYQLVYKDNRWWISSLIWTNDQNGVSLPEKYIAKPE